MKILAIRLKNLASLAGPFEFERTDDYSQEIPDPWLKVLESSST